MPGLVCSVLFEGKHLSASPSAHAAALPAAWRLSPPVLPTRCNPLQPAAGCNRLQPLGVHPGCSPYAPTQAAAPVQPPRCARAAVAQAAVRCAVQVGGCPVYVSDQPEAHDAALLRKLVLPDGRVLRALLPGRPTRDTLFSDVGADGVSALKVWSRNPAGGVVGAFNVQGVAWSRATHENVVLDAAPPAVAARVCAADVSPGGPTVDALDGAAATAAVASGEGHAAWLHRASRLALLPQPSDTVELTLAHREWEIVTLAPLQRRRAVAWAAIGLADMLNSGGAVRASELTGVTGGVRARLVTRGAGRFVAYCWPAPTRVLIDGGDGEPLPFVWADENGQLTLELPCLDANVTVLWDGQ